ncbi:MULTISPECIES: flagellar biosynthesis protein FliQ [Pseudothermotoga]|uniref:Flagellar biosynthetic protein FliQ n=1 Tax=Pseudothermotoga lettingae (strain ATCC BAA-301 / DSM 14385 / NBRC 107922 / TMO) TaxID=416591 RepID=A8F4V8_PSELT|nr:MULTISPECIES: flagellar biosynthesis protein FliQ [Pseudothermotoga]ABV33192.1 flagellar biosynthetic protein FliQ [Pseudothermotoga lettingae TMO]MDK2884197.1 flagellar biosynthesis protein FliQ [Pseudothermotoga sp.]GLI49891.1 flagellar biosynthetic protein FliQ [Pseudothermotoga lettingae TMO]
MTIEVFIDAFKNGIETVLVVVTPALLISLVVGLIISIFQAVTQIHEQTLTFAPKIIVVLLTVMFLGGWMLEKIVEYAKEMWEKLIGMI